MKAVPIPPNEAERLRLVKNLETLDSESEDIFDTISQSVALICETPLALVSLEDDYKQLFKPGTKTDEHEAYGEAAFYTCAIKQDQILIVPDVLKDERFKRNPPIFGKRRIRFYAGVPIQLSPTIKLGTLCVMDYRPRQLKEKQQVLMKLLAKHIVSVIRLRLDKLETNRDLGALLMAKQKLQYQKDLMEAIFDNEPECVKILSDQGELEQINQAGLNMFEVATLAEARNQKLIAYVLPEYRDRYSALESKVFRGEHATAEYPIKGMKGTERWMESHAAPLHDQQGKIINMIAVTRDITRAKQAQREQMLASRVFTDAEEGIIITDAQGAMIDVNPAFCLITGYSREEVLGQNPRMLQSGIQSPDFYATMWRTLRDTGHWKGEIWNRKKNGELYAELMSLSALRDEAGNVINYIALLLDITSVRQQAQADRMVHYGAHTGLPKHSLFTDRLKQALASSKRDKTLLAVCHLGLDHFSKMNDKFGHETCNVLLIETAKRIKACMREKDTASSLGGDEFALIIGGLQNIVEWEQALDRVHHSIVEPHFINDQTVILTASSGAVIYPAVHADHETLLRHAKQSMLLAKLKGRNRHHLFDPAVDV